MRTSYGKRQGILACMCTHVTCTQTNHGFWRFTNFATSSSSAGTFLQQNLNRSMTLRTVLRASKELYLVQFLCDSGVLVVEREDIESTEAVSIGDTVPVLYNKKKDDCTVIDKDNSGSFYVLLLLVLCIIVISSIRVFIFDR